MLETATNSLNFPQRKDRLKETAEIALTFIRKSPSPSRWQIIQELQALGFSEIQANQALRKLEDNHEIFLIEDSSFLKVVLHRDLTQYDQERSKLTAAWLKAREEGE